MFNKNYIITFFRILSHNIFIIWVFLLSLKIRGKTDLIPLTQIRIPPVIFSDLIFYSFLSCIIFVFWWINKNFYTINKYPDKNAFFKTRIYWSITITFLAYFGHWFIFSWWISRLIIFWSVIIVGIFLPFLDFFFYQKN